MFSCHFDGFFRFSSSQNPNIILPTLKPLTNPAVPPLTLGERYMLLIYLCFCLGGVLGLSDSNKCT